MRPKNKKGEKEEKKKKPETEFDSYLPTKPQSRVPKTRVRSSRSGQLWSEVRASWQRTKAGPKRQLNGRQTDR